MKIVLPIVALIVVGLGLLTYQLRASGPEETTVVNRTTQAVPGSATTQAGVRLQPQGDVSGTGTSSGVRLAPQTSGTTGSTGSTGTTGTTGASAQEVVLQYNEAQLTQEARASLVGQSVADTPLGRATVRTVEIQLENGEVLASGQAAVGSMNLPYTITGTVSVQQNRPAVRVLDARAGGFSLPDDAVKGIEQTLQSQIEQLLAQERLNLRSIVIRNGVLRVTGTRR